MANAVKWVAGNSPSTGIAAESIAAGANFLGSEIDNATNEDRWLDLDILFSCASAPTANKTLEIYLIQAVDGTNYEDGGAAVDPTKSPAAIVAARAVTGNQRVALPGIAISPRKFKVLVKSELDQTADVTVTARTHNEEIQ